MTALDTNVLVRFIVADDAAQAGRAKAFVARAAEEGERLFVSCESVATFDRALLKETGFVAP